MTLKLLKSLIYLQASFVAGFALFWICASKATRRQVGYRPVILFGVLAAACFMAPNLWLLHFVFLVIVPAIARGRAEVAPVYLLALLATPSFEMVLRPGGVKLVSYSVHETLALGGLLALRLRSGRRTRRRTAADLPFLIIALLTLAIAARGTSSTDMLRDTVGLVLTLGIPYFVVTRSISTAEELRAALLWVTAGAAMLAAQVIYEMITFWPLYQAAIDHFGLRGDGALLRVRFGWLRATGPLMNATVMGMVLVAGLAAAIASHRAFPSRLKHMCLMAFICFGLIAPQSRGAWVGAGVVVLSMSLYGSRRNRAVPFLVGMCTLAGAWRWGSTDEETSTTVDYRARLWERGLEEFWKNPLTGDTYGAVVGRMQDLVQGEGIVDFVNTYLYFALMTGFVGLSLFVVSLTVPLANFIRQKRHIDALGKSDVAAFCFSFILAEMVMIAFTSFSGRHTLLLLFVLGLSGVLAADLKSSKRGQSAPSRPSLRQRADAQLT